MNHAEPPLPAPVILIVEDDPAIRRGLELNFQAEGFESLAAPTAEAGAALLRDHEVSAVLLDIRLPGMSGLDLCREIRAAENHVPIVLVSARGSEADVVAGLEAGADDYVVKPFRINELVARVRVRLRRQAVPAISRFGDVEVDHQRREVRRAQVGVELSATEFDLLRLFVRRAGDVLTRDTILNVVWGADYQGTDRTVDNFINRLRAKLDVPGAPRFFHTVRGVGYRFDPDGATVRDGPEVSALHDVPPPVREGPDARPRDGGPGAPRDPRSPTGGSDAG